MAGDGNWNKLLPVAGEKARLVSGIMRDNNSGIETAMNAEHIFNGTTAATQTGAHRQGSARAFFQDSAPATAVDGSAFASTDLGSLWFDTNSSPDNILYVLTATTPTWTPVSTEIIATLLASARVFGSTLGVASDFAVNTDKLTVDAATGNTLIAGTLDVTGNLDPTSFEATNGGFIDEDSMATDSATKVPSQQSVKAYVDNQIDATVGSGTTSPLAMTGSNDSIGEITLPNGFIMKWGKKTITGTDGTITFTTEGLSAFPNACFQVIVCGGNSSSGTTQTIQSHTPTATSFKWHTGNGADLTPARWFAIGY